MTLAAAVAALMCAQDAEAKYAFELYASVADRLGSPIPEEREQARRTLEPGARGARDTLRRHLVAGDEQAGEAAAILAVLAEPAALDFLPLDSPDVVRRRNALEGVALLGGAPRRAADLLRFLRDADLGVRLAAARALATRDTAEAGARLAKASGAEAVLLRAIIEAAKTQPETDAIERALFESGGDVRDAGIAAAVNFPSLNRVLAQRWDEPVIRPDGVLVRYAQPRAARLSALFADEMNEEVRPLLGALLVHQKIWGPEDLHPFVGHPRAGTRAAALRLLWALTQERRVRVVCCSLELMRDGSTDGRDDGSRAARPVRDVLEDHLAAACGFRAPGEALETRLARYTEWWSANQRPLLGAEVSYAVADGVGFLRAVQQKDGSWKYCACGHPEWSSKDRTAGTTALALYAMLRCDVPVKDPSAQRALRYLLDKDPRDWPGVANYTASTMALALSEAVIHAEATRPAALDSKTLKGVRSKLEACVQTLVDAQTTYELGAAERGAWSYIRRHEDSPSRGRYDNSNTQFAVLGLRAAANAGVKVPARVWEKALRHYRGGQIGDGRWPYSREDASEMLANHQSMTAAGVASVLMCGASLTGRPTTDIARAEPQVKKALKWLSGAFDLSSPIPPRWQTWDHGTSLFYRLYSLERAMLLAGETHLGERDWYHEGALWMCRAQRRDGSWMDTVDTAFALLFLKRANVDVATERK